MLHIENEWIRKHLLDGCFGLEKEGLRILENGFFSHTPDPFPEDEHIVKDFCENQTEINTSVHISIQGALRELESHNRRILSRLQRLPQKEYLWMFSNPPYIENEQDIPIAVFGGSQKSKMDYREYLSDKYGRYKMTFSGIHVNFSFAEELLEAAYKLQKKSGYPEYKEYKNQLYLKLAKQLAAAGWILVAITAASPTMDSSFVEKGVYDRDVFSGMASVRCSEMGYWNDFSPILDYENITAYADSIQKYVDAGMLSAPSELYYPIRLKTKGANDLERLRKYGANHIELRMFDLNPLAEAGVEEKDIFFAQLLIIWLVSIPEYPFTQKEQVQAVRNFKNAARYDLKTVKILTPDGKRDSVAGTAMNMIDRMKAFYQELKLPVQDILDYEYQKFVDAENRYAWKIRKQFQNGYVKKALAYTRERQEK